MFRLTTHLLSGHGGVDTGAGVVGRGAAGEPVRALICEEGKVGDKDGGVGKITMFTGLLTIMTNPYISSNGSTPSSPMSQSSSPPCAAASGP